MLGILNASPQVRRRLGAKPAERRVSAFLTPLPASWLVETSARVVQHVRKLALGQRASP